MTKTAHFTKPMSLNKHLKDESLNTSNLVIETEGFFDTDSSNFATGHHNAQCCKTEKK